MALERFIYATSGARHKARGETRIVARAKSIYPQTPYAHSVMKGYGHLSVQIKFSACLVTRAKASSYSVLLRWNILCYRTLCGYTRDILSALFVASEIPYDFY